MPRPSGGGPRLKSSTLIYNPVAGRYLRKRAREIQQATRALQDAGIAVKLAATTGPRSASQLAQAAVGAGDTLILVCGGDGTINEVINGIAPGEATLGILPGGTANIFARELRLPLRPVEAARKLPQCSPRRIALGQARWLKEATPSSRAPERRYFLSVAGVGFDASIVRQLSPGYPRFFGAFAYGWEAVRQVFRYRFPSFNCQMEGQEFRATFAVVARTKLYAGWMLLAPGANILGDDFRVLLFQSEHRARYFLYAAAAALHRHLRLSDVELVAARKVECRALHQTVEGSADASTPVYFQLDGELAGKLPATFEIVPDALTVLVP